MMRTRPNILSLAAVAAFLAGLAGMASVAEAFTISGRIVIVGGKPSAGATVWIDLLHRAKTDSLGDYTLGGLWNEKYVVNVWAEHCLASIMDTVRVSNGDVTGVNDTIVAADIVEDGRINLYDAGELLRHYGAAPDSASWDEALDFDGSGTIDSLDMVALMSCWRDTNDVSAPPGFLKVTEPNAATVWLAGQQDVPIRWDTGNLDGPVAISLLWGHDLIDQVTLSTPNDGSFTDYDVPIRFGPGSEYQIEVYHRGSASGASSECFTIQKPSIAVTAPDTHTVWLRGQANVAIRWESSFMTGSVSIALYRNGGLVEMIASSTPNDGEFSEYAVPLGLTVGSGYQIRISPDWGAESASAHFEIGKPSGWNWLLPSTGGYDLNSVSFVDENTGTTVGEYGAILRTNDGGATWIRQWGSTRKTLRGVDFLDANTGIAVGDGGIILKTTDGGATWVCKASGLRKADLYSVTYADADTIVAVGSSMGVEAFCRSMDGGETWASSVSYGYGIPRSVSFFDAKIGAAAADGGAVYWTTNGGATWNRRAGAWSNDDGDTAKGITMLDANTAIVIGRHYYGVPGMPGDWYGVICVTRDASVTWSRVYWSGELLNSISFADANTGVAVAEGGSIVRSTDGGATWTLQAGGIGSSLNGVSFGDATTGTAVGAYGRIIKTTDSGATWTLQTPSTGASLLDISFSDGDAGLVVGGSEANGIVLRTTDGGATWTSRATSGGALYDISMADADTGMAVGGYITYDQILHSPTFHGVMIKTVDGGITWSTRSFADTLLDGTALMTPSTGVMFGSYYTDPNSANFVLRTQNGGATWSVTQPIGYIIEDVWFSDANTGTAVGQSGSVYRTHDGGITWIPQTSGTGSWLNSVHFTGSSTGTAVGASGTIRRTVDGGATWTYQPSGTSIALTGVRFLDANTGMAVGLGGTILRTIDGGATWVKQDSGTTHDFFGIYLMDANTAIVVGEGGAILKTTTGGE